MAMVRAGRGAYEEPEPPPVYEPGPIESPGHPVGRVDDPPAAGPFPTTDVNALYQQYFGRDADARELASDTENLGKYGLAQLQSNLNDRAKPSGSRTEDSQSAAGNALYGSGTGNRTNTPGGPFGAAAPPQGPYGAYGPTSQATAPAGSTPQRPTFAPSPAKGALYQQAWNLLQDAALKEVGRYMPEAEVDLHLRNMGYTFDADQRLPLSNVQSWITNNLPKEAEAVAYRSRAGQPSQVAATAPTGAQGQAGGPFPSGEFDDPASHFAETEAAKRYGQRTNPAANSGVALYESFAKEFANSLKGDVFSDQEEAAMRARSFDQLEQHKREEMRQKEVELAQRRIPKTSGVFISEMNRIRDKWDKLKASNENELLTNAVSERQRRLTQAFSVLGSLAASEEGRADAALALAMIPLQLQDAAFNRLNTSIAQGGSLAATTQQLTQLLGIATNSQQYNDQQRSAALGSIGEWLGGLF